MAACDGLDLLAGLAAPTGRAVLCTVVESSGSVPQRPGARMVLSADGALLGTIGGGAIEQLVLDAARELLRLGGTRLLSTHLTRDLGMCCGGKITVFLQTLDAPEILYLFGAGHVARPLCARAQELGFSVEVIDERPEWANAERFPAAARIRIEDPSEVARALAPDDRAAICIVTHDHRLDQQILEACLRKPRRYLGVIGSLRKASLFRQRLVAKGFSPAEAENFRCPMGLPIGAATPEEIAISICAELVLERRRTPASRAVSKLAGG